MQNIHFIYNLVNQIDTFNLEFVHYKPEPAHKHLPQWYKDMSSYVEDNVKKPSKKHGTSATIKKCNPVFDSITSGYLIFTNTDIFIEQKEDGPYIQWKSNNAIDWHSADQVLSHPMVKLDPNGQIPKFINNWGIKTPKGYSSLFMPPTHRDNPLIILPGIVDTDMYHVPVNFPFTIKEGFEGLIPAGTPIVQVMPIKRDNWKMEMGSKKLVIESKKMFTLVTSKFHDGYRNLFWQKKSYK